MLDFQKDRLDYGKLLCPPDGYSLDKAIATTYSLDLNALLAVPVALFYSQTLEGDLSGDRLALLEAVRQLSDKVTLFHQAGKVQIPSKYNRLYAYLEDCLIPIVPPSPVDSFHPKVWVIRFKPGKGASSKRFKFRLLVLSRNLTFDRSWDLAVNLEGEVTDERQETNTPLVKFVRHLLNQGEVHTGPNKTFLQQLGKVEFEVPKGFARINFHPIGIPGFTTGVPNYGPEHLVIVSPFIQDDSLKKYASSSPKEAYLFSRFEELNGVSIEALDDYDCYHLNPLIVEGERALEDQDDCLSQDLHAKLFVQTKGGLSRWFLGSANATNPASGKRNVEFMVELSGRGSSIQGPVLVDTLLGDDRDKGIFISYDRPDKIETDTLRKELNKKLRLLENRLVKSGLSGELVPSGNGMNYDLLVGSVLSSKDINDFLVEVFPMGQESLRQSLKGKPKLKLRFENLTLVDLSRFMGVKISHPNLLESKRFLLQMDIDLPEERLGKIFSLLLQNQDRFFEYLRFLLAQNLDKESFSPKKKGRGGDQSKSITIDAVYEDLLVAASRSPRKLKAVEGVLRMLQEESAENVIVPTEFLELWEHFRGYVTDE